MRISEDRYTRELQLMDVALRFMKNGARNKNICLFTGFKADRIRSLCSALARESPGYVPRPRGRSPWSVPQFMRSPRHEEQTTILARMLSLLGAVPPAAGLPGQQLVLPDPERGQLICFGYEMYCAHVTDHILNFEHAILLTRSLINADYLLLDNCFECEGLVISEHFAKGRKRCSYCGTR